MAITITSISPNHGPTGGRRVVKIVGTGFQLPPAPPTHGPIPVPNPSCEVLFGAVRSVETRVMSTGRLDVLLPAALFAPSATDPGPVNVTVRNLAQDGTVLDSHTATAAFTYQRPQLANAGQEANEGILARVVRNLILQLRREILNNVELTTHVDYDDSPDGGDIAMLAATPGLVIVGPRLKENRFYSTNQSRLVADDDAETFVQRPPYTIDLRFTIIGVDDNANRTLNLLKEVVSFFHRNKMFSILRLATTDPATATEDDYVAWEMELEETPSWAGATNNSSIHVFNGSFVIRGVDIDEDDMRRVNAPTIDDVIPTGAEDVAALVPSAVIFTGESGVTFPAPIVNDPGDVNEDGVGGSGFLEQILPEE